MLLLPCFVVCRLFLRCCRAIVAMFWHCCRFFTPAFVALLWRCCRSLLALLLRSGAVGALLSRYCCNVVALLSRCSRAFVALLLHGYSIAVALLLSRCCRAVFAPLLHCCRPVVALFSRCCCCCCCCCRAVFPVWLHCWCSVVVLLCCCRCCRAFVAIFALLSLLSQTCHSNWRKQIVQMNITGFKNPNWWKADQLAIYKKQLQLSGQSGT